MKKKPTSSNAWGLGVKLTLSFAVLIAAMISVAWLSINQTRRGELAVQELQNETTDQIVAHEIETYSNINTNLTMQFFTATDRGQIDSLLARRAENSARIAALLNRMEQSIESPDERELVQTIVDRRAKYLAAHQDLLRALLEEHQSAVAEKLMVEQVMPALTQYHEALREYERFQQKQIDAIKIANEERAALARRNTLLLISVVVLIAAAIALFIGINLSRHISRRERAEAALQKAHDELEGRVNDRTSQLVLTNQQLAESEQRYRLLFESNPHPMWVYDADTLEFLAVNDAAVSQYGYSREEFLAMTIKDIRPSEDVQALLANAASGEFGHYDASYSWRHRRKDGAIFDVEITWHRIDFVGRPAKIVLANDVTDRKRAEAALATRERQQAAIAELGRVALAGADLQQLFDQAVATVGKTLEVEYCKVLELLPDASKLKLIAGVGWKKGLIGVATVDTDLQSQAGFTLLSREPVIVDDLLAETRFSGPRLLHEHQVVSGISVIIGSIDTPFGVLGAHSKRRRRFSQEDACFLQSIAHVLAEAVRRKRAEEALRESEANYRDLIEHSREVICTHDLEGRLLSVNSYAGEIAGYAKDELLKMSIVDLLVPRVRSEYETYLKRIQEQGFATGFMQIHTRDGQERIWEYNNTLRTEGVDTPIIRGLVRDVTERVRDQKALREGEERLNNIIGNVPGMVWEHWREPDATKQRVNFVSDHVEKMLGYTAEEWLSTPDFWLSLVHPDDRDLVAKGVITNEATTQEFRLITKDGRVVWVGSQAVIIRDDTGKPIGARGVYIDITHLKAAEAETRLQEARFAQLFGNAPLGLLMVDNDDRVVAANDEFRSIFRFSQDEILGQRLNEIIVPETDVKFAADLSARTLSGETIRAEAVRRRKDGSLVPVEIFGVPIITGGKPVGVFAIYVDLTERKLAEVAMAASERKYRDVFTFAPVGIYQALPDGQITVANKALAEMLGYESVDEVLKLRLADDVYFGEQQRQELIAEYKGRGFARDLEIKWKKKDGSVIWIELTAHAIKGPDGQTQYFEGFVHDITGRKRMEDERHLISEIIQGVSDTSDLNDLLNLIHQLIGKYLYAENCFVALYDEETKLMHFPFWVDKLDPRPEPRPLGIGFSSYVLRTGKPMLVSPELTQLMYERGEVEKSGSTSASWMGVPLRTPTRSIGVLVVQHYEEESVYDERDLEFLASVGNQIALAIERKRAETNLREAEERLRQSQKMESIGNLAGGIAHDFNNLMTAVTGYAELALRSIENDDGLRNKIQEIKKAGDRATSLTRQLLAFSRKQMLQPRVLDLNQVISEMDKMLRRLIGEDIILQASLAENLGQIKADPGQIEQVLMNLVVNARDAMPKGGHLSIETQNVNLDSPTVKGQDILKPGRYVMLSVTDNGCGMDSETQVRVFEPFFTTKEFGKGTGLGLSTVFGIVKQSEGNVWLYSEPGKGTTFKIYLPRVDEETCPSEAEETRKPTLTGAETVLLVEDEQVVRDLSQHVLEHYGYNVISAADGEEGLRACQEFRGRIDLIITDVVMPRMSGRELAEKVSALRPGTQVLFMSGFTDDAIVRHGLLTEDLAFIQKPFSPESLAAKARELLDQAKHSGLVRRNLSLS